MDSRVTDAALRRRFWQTAAALLAFRLVFSAWLPLTGDEAYFYLWGKTPDWGFYDHPPMVGWWLAGLLPLGDAVWWLRLPSTLAPTLLALAALAWLRPLGERTAILAALFILLAPVNVWNVAITTDTPLMIFGVLSALAFWRGARDEDYRWYALAGLLLAGATLSKYFAALLAAAYFAATLLAPSRRRFAGLLLTALPCLPAVGLMLWWNSENCWPNILFNLYNRNTRAGFHWQHPALYAAMLVFMLGILPLWYALRRRAAWRAPWAGGIDDRVWQALAVVPFLLFAVVSLGKEIGMHWVLTFIPLALIAIARHLDDAQTKRCLNWLNILAVLQAGLFLALLATPLSVWQSYRIHNSLVLTFKPAELIAAARPLAPGLPLFVEGYSDAATLSHAAREHVGVIGQGSRYARQDDVLTDFRELDGKALAILGNDAGKLQAYAPYFRQIEPRQIELAGTRFHLLIGQGFDYPAYRDGILRAVGERYYRIPDWLPQRRCFFRERYLSDAGH